MISDLHDKEDRPIHYSNPRALRAIKDVTTGLNPSEVFVARLCQRAFLKLWTHPNPIGKKGKELCDCLVVCGVHVLIISVKEIEYRDTGDKVGWERWHKAAIDKSAKQIWGAERWLRTASSFQRADGREITLPPESERKYHRISVSLGSRGEAPIRWGDLANGFVHVLDEHNLDGVFIELDTITDFVEYLSATESLLERGVRPVFSGGGVEDLLAMYLRNGETFGIVEEDGTTPDLAIITGDIWPAFITSQDYLDRKQDLKSSYVWDRLIDRYAENLLTDGMLDMHSKKVTKNELALVAMALQPRWHRTGLADALLTFLKPDGAKIAARAIAAANATAFVFFCGDSSDRESRSGELALRCLVVRGRCPNVTTVVGLAMDRPQAGKTGHSTDIIYIHMPFWTKDDDANVEGIQRDLEYFKNTKWPN